MLENDSAEIESVETHQNYPWLENAVLFYGPRKAGTTLSLNLLDGGQELFVSPSEIKLKDFADMDWKTGVRFSEYYETAPLRHAEFQNFDTEHYNARLEEHAALVAYDLKTFLNLDLSLQYEAAKHKSSKIQKWVMKEVGGKTTKIIELYRKMFAQGKIVMITRDPKMVARSVLKDRKRKNMRLNWRDIYWQVKAPYLVLNEQFEFWDQENVLFIAYEDLVDPEALPKVLKNICEFLHIEFNDKYKTPSVFGLPEIVKTASQKTTEVFREDASWFSGLTWRERCLVFLFSTGLALWYVTVSKRGSPYTMLSKVRVHKKD